jgi:MFS transporter, DHA1 family, multidrug resistance protein
MRGCVPRAMRGCVPRAMRGCVPRAMRGCVPCADGRIHAIRGALARQAVPAQSTKESTIATTRSSGPSRGLTIALGCLAALGAAGIDIYLPGLPAIDADLAAGGGQATFTLSAFFIGLGFGQIFYGPLSDSYGRRPVLYAGIAIYVVASLACYTADSIAMLTLFRLLQATGAAAGGVIARAIVRDLCELNEAAKAQAAINVAFLVTPLLAPNIGGWVLTWFGWREIFLVLTLFGAVCMVVLHLKVPESLPPERRRPFGIMNSLRGYKQVLMSRQSVGCIAASAFSFACMFAFFADSPFVYIELYGVRQEHYGLLFACNVVGIMIANMISGRMVVRFGALRMLLAGCLVCTAGGLALLGFVLLDIGGLPAIVGSMFFIVGSLGLVGANAIAGALQPHPRLAGTAAALFGCLQISLGAVVASLVGVLHDGTPLPMAGVIAVMASIGLLARLTLVRDQPDAAAAAG